jgi:hypothetical protein
MPKIALWKCVCGWKGTYDLLKQDKGRNFCPACGASGKFSHIGNVKI